MGDWRGGFFGQTNYINLDNPLKTTQSYLIDIEANDPDTIEENMELLGLDYNSYLGKAISSQWWLFWEDQLQRSW